jgi:hypothetical protein
MMNLLKLFWLTICGAHAERLDGSGLFCGEYSNAGQFLSLAKLFGDHPFIRMPYRKEGYQAFKQSALTATQCGVQIIALLDQFDNNDTMIRCLDTIKNEMPFIKHIELFNELPACKYPGQQIKSLQELIMRTNTYSDWIHANMPGVQVLTMAPYNSIDERAFDEWGVTNTRILKDLVLYTTADIAAVHIYGDSISERLQMLRLADNLKSWNKETPYKKAVWITEIGVDGWKNHVAYYHSMVRLAVNVMHPDKLIWYRASIDHLTSPDAVFALENRNNGEHSPLWDELA